MSVFSADYSPRTCKRRLKMQSACDDALEDWMSMFSEEAENIWNAENKELRRAMMVFCVLKQEFKRIEQSLVYEISRLRQQAAKVNSLKERTVQSGCISAPATTVNTSPKLDRYRVPRIVPGSPSLLNISKEGADPFAPINYNIMQPRPGVIRSLTKKGDDEKDVIDTSFTGTSAVPVKKLRRTNNRSNNKPKQSIKTVSEVIASLPHYKAANMAGNEKYIKPTMLGQQISINELYGEPGKKGNEDFKPILLKQPMNKDKNMTPLVVKRQLSEDETLCILDGEQNGKDGDIQTSKENKKGIGKNVKRQTSKGEKVVSSFLKKQTVGNKASIKEQTNKNEVSSTSDKEEKSNTSKLKYEAPATFLQDYDKVPELKSNAPQHVHQTDVVRRKADRMKLPGWACMECKEYYQGADLPPEELSKKMNACSKHRNKFKPQDQTIAGYWDVDMPETQNSQDDSDRTMI